MQDRLLTFLIVAAAGLGFLYEAIHRFQTGDPSAPYFVGGAIALGAIFTVILSWLDKIDTED